MSREEYAGRAQERRSLVPRLRSDGLSVKKIAATLNISERRVKQLLKESRQGGVRSLPVVLRPLPPFDPSFAGVPGSFFLRACFFFPFARLLFFLARARGLFLHRPPAQGQAS